LLLLRLFSSNCVVVQPLLHHLNLRYLRSKKALEAVREDRACPRWRHPHRPFDRLVLPSYNVAEMENPRLLGKSLRQVCFPLCLALKPINIRSHMKVHNPLFSILNIEFTPACASSSCRGETGHNVFDGNPGPIVSCAFAVCGMLGLLNNFSIAPGSDEWWYHAASTCYAPGTVPSRRGSCIAWVCVHLTSLFSSGLTKRPHRAFSRWVNHLEDDEMENPRTKMVLKALRNF
jgi:hypothetical protein